MHHCKKNPFMIKFCRKFCGFAPLIKNPIYATELPVDSYTHYSDAHGTTSWLDHILVSENIAEAVIDCHIHYGKPSSNHFPLDCVLDWRICDVSMHKVDRNEVIKWNFESEFIMTLMIRYLRIY